MVRAHAGAVLREDATERDARLVAIPRVARRPAPGWRAPCGRASTPRNPGASAPVRFPLLGQNIRASCLNENARRERCRGPVPPAASAR